MRTHWIVVLVLGAVLAACQEPDPLAAARAACAEAQSEAEARIEACTALLDSGALDETERAEALARRGAAVQEAGDVTAALRDYNQALELRDDVMIAVKGRAAILIESGQLDAAEVMAQRLLQNEAFPADANYFVGRIAAARGDAAAALEAYGRAIGADGRYVDAYAARGAILQAQQDYAGALADYDRAININAQLSPALSGRCWTRVLMEDGDLERARADARDAVEIDPRNVQGQLCRGLLSLRAGEWADARAAYDAALEVEPGNPTALFGRGVARRRGGDNDGREDMNQARDFDRHVARRFDDLGVETY